MMGAVVPLSPFLAKSRAWYEPRLRALRDREALTRIVQDLALARGLDDPQTTRALDLVRLGLEYLVGNDAHADLIARLHAEYRGVALADDGTTHAGDLSDAAKRLESLARSAPPASSETAEDRSARRKLLLAWVVGEEAEDVEHVDLEWFASRLAVLRAGLGASDAGKASQLGVGRVLAEITWRAGSHGADKCEGNGKTAEPSDKWLARVRTAIARGR